MQVFAQMSKIDVEKRLVYGRAAQEVPDHSGEVMDYAQSKPNFVKWSGEMSKATNGASQGNIRAMHGQIAAGKVQELIYNDEENAIDVVAKIVDDNEWKKCLEGVYTGFSIGGKYGARVTKGDLKHYEAIPNEISLVDRPCIPTATFFDIQKADGSVMQKQFQSLPNDLAKGTETMNATTAQPETEYSVEGTAEEADELAKMLHDNKLSLGDALAVISKSLGAQAETKEVSDVNESGLMVLRLAKRYDTDELSEFDTAYFAELIELEKVAAREDVSPKEGEKKYGDVKFADEKNNKYPIENEAHIRAAWSYINKEKNAAKYEAKDLDTIKAKIVAAWKGKIDKAGPPAAAEKSDTAVDLKKGIGDVSHLGEILQSIYYMSMRCARETASEGDNSPISGRLKAVALEIASIYKEAATEEADELMAELTEGDMPEVMQMAYGLAAELSKAGARNSAVDADIIQKMHDLTGKLGGKCAKIAPTEEIAAQPEQVAEKADVVDELAKVEQDKNSEDKMAKMMGEYLDPLNKALGAALEKIAKLEAQPVASKGVLRVVSKENDSAVEIKKVEIAPVLGQDGQVNEAASAFKKIHASGGSPLIGGVHRPT